MSLDEFIYFSWVNTHLSASQTLSKIRQTVSICEQHVSNCHLKISVVPYDLGAKKLSQVLPLPMSLTIFHLLYFGPLLSSLSLDQPSSPVLKPQNKEKALNTCFQKPEATDLRENECFSLP